ncbi:MAG: FliM/FliN family flagellar motor switch protein [Planctomycetota bacterium]|jgi:type III secretion system YscQ/HrcQ family protein|nr:FliM/FliN family flagellar motor switch protein [Planctomycetota bacterium]
MVNPLKLRKLSPDLARFHTLVHRYAEGEAFSAGGREWRLAAQPEPGSIPYGPSLYGSIGQSEFVLWLAEPDWRLAVETVLEVPLEAVSALPDELVGAALDTFTGDLLNRLAAATGLPVRLGRVERKASPPPLTACHLTLRRDDDLILRGALVVADSEGECLRVLREKLASRPGKGVLPSDLRLTGRLGLGLGKATLDSLATLATGDVVLAPGGAEWFVLVEESLRFATDWKKGILAVEGKSMANVTPSPGVTPDSLDPLGAVEVELQAQVGVLSLTLDELRKLASGQVVEFATPVESPATLVVGGKAIASGELVDVGGRVGVRITAMATPS